MYKNLCISIRYTQLLGLFALFFIFIRKIIKTNASSKVLCLGFFKSEKGYVYNPHHTETTLKKRYLSEHGILMTVAWKQSLRDVLQHIFLMYPMQCPPHLWFSGIQALNLHLLDVIQVRWVKQQLLKSVSVPVTPPSTWKYPTSPLKQGIVRPE